MVDKILGEFKEKINKREVKKGRIDIVENVRREVGEKVRKIVDDLRAALVAIPEDHEGKKDIEFCINDAIKQVQEKAKSFQKTLIRMIETVEDRALNGKAESAVENGGKDLIKHYKKAVDKLNEYSDIKISNNEENYIESDKIVDVADVSEVDKIEEDEEIKEDIIVNEPEKNELQVEETKNINIKAELLEDFNLAIESMKLSEEQRGNFRNEFKKRASGKTKRVVEVVVGQVLREAKDESDKNKVEAKKEHKEESQEDQEKNDEEIKKLKSEIENNKKEFEGKLNALIDLRKKNNKTIRDIKDLLEDINEIFEKTESKEDLEFLKEDIIKKQSLISFKTDIGRKVPFINARVKKDKMEEFMSYVKLAQEKEGESFDVSDVAEIELIKNELEEMEKNLGVDIKKRENSEQEIRNLIQTTSINLESLDDKNLSSKMKDELKKIIKTVDTNQKDREQKIESIKKLSKELSEAKSGGKMEKPKKNELLVEILGSVNSFRQLYGDNLDYLKDFKNKNEFSDKELENLRNKKLNLERKITFINDADSNHTSDKTLKRVKGRIDELRVGGHSIEAESYVEELVGLFKNSLEKIEEIEALVAGEDKKSDNLDKDDSKDSVATEEASEDTSRVKVAESSEINNTKTAREKTEYRKELPRDDIDALAESNMGKTISISEATQEDGDVDDLIPQEEIDKLISEAEKKKSKTTNREEILSQEDVDALLDGLGAGVEEEIDELPNDLNGTEGTENGEKFGEKKVYSDEYINNMIDEINNIDDLKYAVVEVIETNGKIDMGNGRAWTNDQEVIDGIDDIYKNTSKGQTLRRTMKGNLVIDKIDEIIKNEGEEKAKDKMNEVISPLAEMETKVDKCEVAIEKLLEEIKGRGEKSETVENLENNKKAYKEIIALLREERSLVAEKKALAGDRDGAYKKEVIAITQRIMENDHEAYVIGEKLDKISEGGESGDKERVDGRKENIEKKDEDIIDLIELGGSDELKSVCAKINELVAEEYNISSDSKKEIKNNCDVAFEKENEEEKIEMLNKILEGIRILIATSKEKKEQNRSEVALTMEEIDDKIDEIRNVAYKKDFAERLKFFRDKYNDINDDDIEKLTELFEEVEICFEGEKSTVNNESRKESRKESEKEVKEEVKNLPEFIDGEVKIGEELKNTIREILIENGLSTEKIEEVVNSVSIILDSAIDAEASRDFSRIFDHHKAKIAGGIAVALGATVATAALRVLGGSAIMGGAAKLGVAAVGGTVLGGVSGYLRSKIRGFLNPKIAKLREDDDKKFKEIRKKHAGEVLSKENLMVAIDAAVNSEKFKAGEFGSGIDDIMKSLNKKAEYKDLTEEQKIEIAKGMECLNKTVATNTEKLAGFLNKQKKGKWAELSDGKKGALLGSLFGAISSASNAISENPYLSSTISSAVSGIMAAKSINDFWENKNVEKESKKMADEIVAMEEAGNKDKINIGDLRVYLESGALDKYPLAKEKARGILIDSMLNSGVENRIDSNFNSEEREKELKKRFGLKDWQKGASFVAGVGASIAVGSTVVWASRELREMYDGSKLEGNVNKFASDIKKEGAVDYAKSVAFEQGLSLSAEDVSEKYGISAESLKLSDINNDGKFNISEVAIAQSKELSIFGSEAVISTPVLSGEFSKMKIESQVESLGLSKYVEELGLSKSEAFEKPLSVDHYKALEIVNKSYAGKDIKSHFKLIYDIAKDGVYDKADTQIIVKDAEEVLARSQARIDQNLAGEKFIYTPENIKNINGVDIGPGEEIANQNELNSKIRDLQAEKFKEKGIDIEIKKTLNAKQLEQLLKEEESVVKKVFLDGEYKEGELVAIKVEENAPQILKAKSGEKMMEKYMEMFGDGKEMKIGSVKAGGSVSETLGYGVSADSKVIVINPDGTRLEGFDANLVHENDIVIEREGEVYVFKASGILMKEGDSLDGIYKAIDKKYDLDNVPKDVQDKFNINKGEGNFQDKMSSSEAGKAKELWEKFSEKQKEDWKLDKLSPEQKEEILKKGEWADTWASKVESGGTMNVQQIIADGKNHDYIFDLAVSDTVGADGVPDEVIVSSENRSFKTFERNIKEEESADAFSNRVSESIKKIAVERGAEMDNILSTYTNVKSPELSIAGISQFDDNFQDKVKFWSENKEMMPSPQTAKLFFTAVDKLDVNYENKGMADFLVKNSKFSDGNLDVGHMEKAIESFKLVTLNNTSLTPEKILQYYDEVEGFDDIKQKEGLIDIFEKGVDKESLAKIFKVPGNVELEHKSNGVYILKDVVIDQVSNRRADILFSNGKDGMKFGLDGAGIANVGTRGLWNGIVPDTELTGENINKISKELINKLALQDKNMEDHNRSER